MNALINQNPPPAEQCRPPASTASVLGQTAPSASAKVDPRWQAHYDRLTELRDWLETDMRARDEVTAAELMSRNNFTESAADELERVVNLNGLSAHAMLLLEVEAALHRIRNGSYGICEVTGEPIPAERLAAVPWTRFTTAAAAELERQHQSNPPAEPGEN